MRKIIILEFITLDGIIQGPGGPGEDNEGGFEYGGWVAPYSDEVGEKALKKQLKPADLLLGRKTFDIWENYWPAHADQWPGVNEVTKYVLSGSRKQSDWQNTVFLDSLEDIKKLKESDGAEIKLWGSSQVVQLLLANDLVDEIWLKIYPVILGKGKKLFDDGSIPTAFKLVETTVTPSGVILANYERSGEVETGTVEA